MDLAVPKTGSQTFDALHACGLGLVIANAYQASVRLFDDGMMYRVSWSPTRNVVRSDHLLAHILELPSEDEIKQEIERELPNVRVCNLDGLLGATSPRPGLTLVSVDHMLHRSGLQSSAVKDGIQKVAGACPGWAEFANSVSSPSSLLDVLHQHYDASSPIVPRVQNASDRDISVPMCIDPAFCSASRRTVSDGLISHRSSVTFRGMPFAPVLGYVGAARYLRAQFATESIVNLYVPTPADVTLEPNTAVAPLSAQLCGPDHALMRHSLTCWRQNRMTSSDWNGIAYQSIEMQAAQSPISRARGWIDFAWFDERASHCGSEIVDLWLSMLNSGNWINESLVNALRYRNLDSWRVHLQEFAELIVSSHGYKGKTYGYCAVKEVSAAMNYPPRNVPLVNVLNRRNGTLRFGHALRLLGRWKNAILRDIIAELDGVSTQDQLLRALTHAAQECSVARSSTPYIVIPSDDDLKHLLDDVNEYSVTTISRLLILLSALDYPRSATASTVDDNEHFQSEID